LIPDSTTIFLSSLKLPVRLRGPPSLLFNGQRRSFTGAEQQRCDVDQLQLVLRLRMSGAIPLLHLYAFMAWTGTLYTDGEKISAERTRAKQQRRRSRGRS